MIGTTDFSDTAWNASDVTAQLEAEAARWDPKHGTFFIKRTKTHNVVVRQNGYSWDIVLSSNNLYADLDERWSYASFVAAYLAAEQWDPVSEAEPDGWHRHPSTGRRRSRVLQPGAQTVEVTWE